MEVSATLSKDWDGNYGVSVGFTADRRHVVVVSTHGKALVQVTAQA